MDDKDLIIQDLRRELKAAKRDLFTAHKCKTCKHFNSPICDTCKNKSVYKFDLKYEWRGVCAGNTPNLRREEND